MKRIGILIVAAALWLPTAAFAGNAVNNPPTSGGGGGGGSVTTAAPVSGDGTGGNPVTIANGAIALGKLASQSDQTIICNQSGGAASPSACTAAQTRTVLGVQVSSAVSITGGSISGTTINLLGSFTSGVLGVTTGTGALNTMTLTGLTATGTTLSNDVLTGVSGGQTWIGGTAANNTVTIKGTSHATVSTAGVLFGSGAMSRIIDSGFAAFFSGANPTHPVEIGGTGNVIELKGAGNTNIEHENASGNMSIGTLGATSLKLYTNNTDAVVIDSTGLLQLASSASFAANGSVATVLGSVGPTGSHTTVQKWVQFKDNSGTTLFLPGF